MSFADPVDQFNIQHSTLSIHHSGFFDPQS
jgi:hypothetical protein